VPLSVEFDLPNHVSVLKRFSKMSLSFLHFPAVAGSQNARMCADDQHFFIMRRLKMPMRV